jgi:hypothetical protein
MPEATSKSSARIDLYKLNYFAIRLAMSTCHKMSVTKMRMLRWISWKTRKDRIQNEEIRMKIGVAPIDEMMRKSQLRWFDHVQMRAITAPVKKSELIQVEGTN